MCGHVASLRLIKTVNAIIAAILLAVVLGYLLSTQFPPKSSPQLKNADLVAVLLNLEEESLNELFKLYKAEFGHSAARYAQHTYHKWKTGEVRPNRQTFSRFLVHLPKVMSFDLKCEVLRQLRAEYCAKDNYQLIVYTDNWQNTLSPLVTGIIEKAYTSELPKPLEERLSWLSDNEMLAARAILAESQAQESRNAVALLQDEFANIERLLADAEGARHKVTHKLRLPYGTITLQIKRGRPDE